jgi:hypothetical protein
MSHRVATDKEVNMPHPYSLLLTVEGSEDTTLSGEFQDEQWSLLEKFVLYVTELSETKFLQSGDGGELRIQHDQSGMVVEVRLPPLDDISVFLHKFRPLILQKESTYFNKIHNILAKELTHPYFRSFLSEQHATFNGKDLQAAFQLRINDVLINSEKVLYEWLNAQEYHRLEDSQKFIAYLHQWIPLEASKVIFLQLLLGKAQAAYNVALLVKVILGQQEGFTNKI